MRVWRIEKMNAFPPTYLSTESQPTFAFFSIVIFFSLLATPIALLQIVYYPVISSPIFSMFILFFFLASCALVFFSLENENTPRGAWGT